MRALRPIAGLVLSALGAVLLFCAVTLWFVGQQRDESGAFTAQLAPVHTDGYAIVVPDVSAALRRHGVAGLLGAGQVRAAAGSDEPVLLFLAPAAEVSLFLDGVARTELSGVGYAAGAQPVSVSDLTGDREPSALPTDDVWRVAFDGDPLRWSAGDDVPLSLFVVREDGEEGLTVTFTVGVTPSSWIAAAGLISLVLAFVVFAGAGLLVWPSRPGQVGSPDAVPLADQIAERLAAGWAVPHEAGDQWDYDQYVPRDPVHQRAAEESYVDSAT